MEVGLSPARQARTRHRHELRTLTYVTLDQANGGVVRNLSHDGIAVQAVAAPRPRQQVRVRFELRYPRLRVETRGEVVWSTFSGQCGIRFLDLSPRLARQIDEWIFGDLLEGLSLPWEQTASVFGAAESASLRPAASARAQSRLADLVLGTTIPAVDEFGKAEAGKVEAEKVAAEEKEDGLIVSPAPVKVIELAPRTEPPKPAPVREPIAVRPAPARVERDWLSQPLSGRSLAWTVDTLVVVAAVLLFQVVFLFIIREPPRWPVATAAGTTIAVAGLYWGFFKTFGGTSLGERLARLAGTNPADDEEARDARFR
jgi:PilZ domain